jgi:hypothetical protein
MAAPQLTPGPLRQAWTAKATLRRIAVLCDKAGGFYEERHGKLAGDGGRTGPGPDGFTGLSATRPRGKGRSYEFYGTNGERRQVIFFGGANTDGRRGQEATVAKVTWLT